MPLVKFGADNQNLEMYYQLHGTGKTKIIFIMGLLTDGNAWMCQVRSIFIPALIHISI
jgi:pimeloyl-ACP methyl ester carboxylesterase